MVSRFAGGQVVKGGECQCIDHFKAVQESERIKMIKARRNACSPGSSRVFQRVEGGGRLFRGPIWLEVPKWAHPAESGQPGRERGGHGRM